FVTQQQPAKAVMVAKEQMAKVPDSSAFHDLLGTVLFDNVKDLPSAEAEFKKAVELDKTNADALLKLGQVQTAAGTPDRALATYQRAIKDNPRDLRFYIVAGQLYEAKRDWSSAQANYQKA